MLICVIFTSKWSVGVADVLDFHNPVKAEANLVIDFLLSSIKVQTHASLLVTSLTSKLPTKLTTLSPYTSPAILLYILYIAGGVYVTLDPSLKSITCFPLFEALSVLGPASPATI